MLWKVYIGNMIRKYLPLVLFPVMALSFSGCAFFNGDNQDKGASSVAEFSSSSSAITDTGRVEIEYSDTLQVGKDTVAYQLADSLDSWNLFLGKFPKGTLVHVGFRVGSLDTSTTFLVQTELGARQLPTNAGLDGNYRDYVKASLDSLLRNYVILDEDAYYYLVVHGARRSSASAIDSLPEFYARIIVDTAYYQFTGREDSLQIPSNQDIQGYFRLDRDEDSTILFFGANVGSNLTLTTSGQNLNGVLLQERGSQDTIRYGASFIRHQLLPQDSTLWQVRIRSVIPSWNSGNYAFFTLNLNSIKLGKGEYLANPDTLLRAGDTLAINRVGSENSGWDVRHDSYIWLGNLAVGDTVQILYGMSGLANVTKLATILDASGNPVDTLSQVFTLNWLTAEPNVFVPPATGGYYLHYVGIGKDNTYWSDPNFTLHLKALVQKNGSVSAWNYDPATFSMAPGDTLDIAEALVFQSIAPSDASRNYRVLLPRGERDLLQDSIDIVYTQQGTATPVGDQVLSSWLRAVSGASGTVHLLIQSVADPTQVDTCLITVGP